MSSNAKFSRFILAPIVVALLVVVTSPVISWAEEFPDSFDALMREEFSEIEGLFNSKKSFSSLKDALVSYRENPKSYSVRFILGFMYSQIGEYEKSFFYFKEGLGLKKDFFKKLVSLIKKKVNNDPKINLYYDKKFEEILNDLTDNDVFITLVGYALVFNKLIDTNPEKVISGLKKINASESNQSSIYALNLAIAAVYANQKQYEKTILSLGKAASIKPDWIISYVLLGITYYKLDRKDEVITSIKKVTQLKPDKFYTHLILGIVYQDVGHNYKAIASLNKALRLNPVSALTHLLLGDVYRLSGQNEEAIASYKEAIRIEPDYANAHYNLGITYRKSGQNEEAIASFKEAIRIKPDYANAHYNLGITYRKSGQNEEAIASYKEAIRIEPDYTNAHYNLGYTYDNLGKYEEAIASFKEAIRIKPDYANAHYNLGITYRKSGQNEEAIASYKEAIRIKPDDPDAHNNLGYTYDNLGKYEEAIASYKEALRIDPNATKARKNLNKLEQKTADERLAREQRLLKEEKKKHQARQNLKEADRLAHERRLLEEERKKLEAAEERQRQAQAEKKSPPHKEQKPQSGSGSGFFVSKMGHVITNAHVVQNCKKVTIGDNANKQVPAELINTDRSNDLALLKLSTLEMASAESKSLIQKLSIVVVPLASKGLLRSDDVRLGEKVHGCRLSIRRYF